MKTEDGTKTNPGSKSAGAVTLYLEEYARFEPDLLCPEISVYNTLDLHGLWTAISQLPDVEANLPEIPYWGIVWPGARALARFVLDHREMFHGRRVLDLACGSGLIGLAAAKAGACVTGIDLDPHAVLIARQAAKLNKLECRFEIADMFTLIPADFKKYDIVLTAEVFHTKELADKSIRLLTAFQGAPAHFIGDCGRQYRPPDVAIRVLASFPVPVLPDIEGVRSRDGRIFQIRDVDHP